MSEIKISTPQAALRISVPQSEGVMVKAASQQLSLIALGVPSPAGPAGADGAQGPKGEQGPSGPSGPSGLSAYDVAVADGFVGTRAEWLASLGAARGLPSGYTAHVFGGVLYFGYGSYGGGGWAVLRNDAGALALAGGANNAATALPTPADWPALTFTGY